MSVDANLIDSVMWDENTPLSCLVPTLTGDGACTTALVDLIVGVHNEFMEKCQNEMKKKSKKEYMHIVSTKLSGFCLVLIGGHTKFLLAMFNVVIYWTMKTR